MTGTLHAFLGQPCRRYRDFQVAYTLLTLNFVIPALSYTFQPDVAVASFLDLNALLGGTPYTFPEAGSRLWRYLGAANVMTLGFSCFLLQLDLRRFYAVLVPLTFMKAYAATCWLFGWFVDPGARVFLAAALFDFATCAAFVFFAVRARREMDARPDAPLVPRPLSARVRAGTGGGPSTPAGEAA